MYLTYGSEMARSRMQDRMREADHYRLTKGTRQAHAAERRSTIRKVTMASLHLLAWQVKR
jgi:hypothetical protein